MNREDSLTGVYYIVLAVLSLDLFYWANHLDGVQIKFFLDFYKSAVELFFGNYHYYDESTLSYYGDGYTIGKACLGLNIIIFIFTVASFVNVGKVKGYKKILWVLCSAVMAVVIGVFSNLLRLIGSIYFTAFASFEFIHALLGIVIYLAAIIFCYRLSKDILKYIRREGGGGIHGQHN